MPRPVLWRDRLGYASLSAADKRIQIRVTSGELAVVRARAEMRRQPVGDYLMSLVAAEIIGEAASTPPDGGVWECLFTPSACKSADDVVQCLRGATSETKTCERPQQEPG